MLRYLFLGDEYTCSNMQAHQGGYARMDLSIASSSPAPQRSSKTDMIYKAFL
jgi:hypothetical protein